MSDRSRFLWRWHLRDLPQRRPSWFLSSQMVPLLFWALFNGLRSFEPRWATLSALLMIPVVCAGAASFALLRSLKGQRGASKERLLRTGVLASSLYYTIAGAVTSAYMLGIALEAAAELRQGAVGARWILLVMYALSALLSLVYSPHTLVRSEEQERESRQRESRWLPWALGCQGFLVAAGVFLASWLLHGEFSWESLLLGGLAALGALILVTFSMIGLHRFFVLAGSPIPVGDPGALPPNPT